jgi:hypothetical protein
MSASGLPFFGIYSQGYIYYDIGNGKIDGILYPLKTSGAAPIDITGYQDEFSLSVDFHLPEGNLRGEFERGSSDDKGWTQIGGGIILWRLDGEPSETALTLQELGCGSDPGSLSIRFRANRLHSDTVFPKELGNLPIQVPVPQNTPEILGFGVSRKFVRLDQAWPYIKDYYLKKKDVDNDYHDSIADLSVRNNGPDLIKLLKQSGKIEIYGETADSLSITFMHDPINPINPLSDIGDVVLTRYGHTLVKLKEIWKLIGYENMTGGVRWI